jgi:serine/threonine-protein kinase
MTEHGQDPSESAAESEDAFPPAFEEQLKRQLTPEFELVRRLGGGRLSSVYLAREPALQRLVAVKVLHADLARHTKSLARFRREAMALASISHPNVVSIFRVGDLSSAAPYLVMQYVRGRNLKDRLVDEGPLRMDAACVVLAEVSEALAAVHLRDLAHRDVRPQNILCEYGTERALLADFGLAAHLRDSDEADSRLTTAGHIVTDYRFSSPEVLRGSEPTAASDVYSLGVLGYYLLAGSGPFPAKAPEAQARAHLTLQPLSLASLGVDVPPRLAKLLTACLAKEAGLRPQTGEVGQALRAVVAEMRRDPDSGAVGEASHTPKGPSPSLREAGAPRYAMRLLGGLDLTSATGSVGSVLRQPKRVALLAFLASGMATGLRRRDTLLGIFWPDSAGESGRHSLRQALYVLRRELGPDVLVTRGDEEVGLSPAAIYCDAADFRRLVGEGRAGEAMERYEGDLLPGFYLDDAPEFERWLDVERLRLRRLAAEAAWRLANETEAGGDFAKAALWARRAVDLDPFDEAGLHRLIGILDASGDRAGALAAYDHFRRRLRDEYAVDPSPETRQLVDEVRSRQ